MTREKLSKTLDYWREGLISKSKVLELICGQPFDGETERINTTKSASSTSSATEESSVAATIGNEADFVTKSMTEDEIVAAKMAKDRVESDRWYAMFNAPLPLTTPEPDLNPDTEESSATDHFRDATKMVSGESSSPTPNPHNQ